MKPIGVERLDEINRYIEELFAPLDPVLERNLDAARAAGLPAIHVSAAQGKLLYLLTKIAGARRVLEIGTLSGFSTTWLARALPPGGRLITLEADATHAGVARRNLEGVAAGADVEVRLGNASELLRAMINEGEGPFDMVFIDADKPAYVTYLELALQLSRPGTIILADNLIRDGLVLDPASDDVNARAARTYNATVASHPRLESIVLPIVREMVDGLAISIVRA